MRDETLPGVIGDRYETVRLIGRGGMGSVWLATDRLLGRDVAIKQIGALPGETEREAERALREARTAAALNHPNVVALYDAINHEGTPWLVMEYVSGPTLAAWVREHGPLQPEVVADLGARLASGLAAAHRAGIVHRDIKPANVFMADDGEPKIGDFGTARGASEDNLTLAGMVTGTPSYMAPEVADGGEHAEAADVWALGTTLYLAVEGQDAYPGKGNALATLRAIATEPPRAPQRAGALEPVLAQMLTHDPSRRGSMDTAMERLDAVASGRPAEPPTVAAGAPAPTPADEEETSAHFVGHDVGQGAAAPLGASTAEEGPRTGRRRAVLAGLVVAGLVGGLGLAAVVLGTEEGPEATPPTMTVTSTERSVGSTSRTSQPTSPTTSEGEPPAPTSTTGVVPQPPQREAPTSVPGRPPSPPSRSGSTSTTPTPSESPSTSTPEPSATSSQVSPEPTSEPTTPSAPEPEPTPTPTPEPTTNPPDTTPPTTSQGITD